jgi:glycosyltransferase involved in cell wall biosynthesis
MSASPPEISVVICTRDRASQLRGALDACAAMLFDGAWEVVIVDNGSTDDTRAVIERMRPSFDGRLEAIDEPCRGLSAARNAGYRAARAPLVAFTDDDCYPAPDWLSQLKACLDTDPRLGFVGGQILLYDPADQPITILTHQQRRDYPARSVVQPGAVQGANLAVRRAALDEVCGFDVRLGPGTPYVADDIDVLARILACGWTGAYDPRPVVFHHHRRQSKAEAAAVGRSYLKGAGAYYVKCLADSRSRPACARFMIKRAYRDPLLAVQEFAGAVRFLVDVKLSGIRTHLAGPFREGEPGGKSHADL